MNLYTAVLFCVMFFSFFVSSGEGFAADGRGADISPPTQGAVKEEVKAPPSSPSVGDSSRLAPLAAPSGLRIVEPDEQDGDRAAKEGPPAAVKQKP